MSGRIRLLVVLVGLVGCVNLALSTASLAASGPSAAAPASLAACARILPTLATGFNSAPLIRSGALSSRLQDECRSLLPLSARGRVASRVRENVPQRWSITKPTAPAAIPGGARPRAVVSGTPVATSAPTISGVVQDAQTLTATNGQWSGDGPITFGYQWERCNASGGGCSSIFGATDSTYVLTKASVGHTIRVRVIASNLVGTASSVSAATTKVRANPDALAGTPDSQFGTSGSVTVPYDTEGPSVSLGGGLSAFAEAPDGSLVAASTVSANNGPPGLSLSRFTANGTLDTTFGAGGSILIAPQVDPDGYGAAAGGVTVLPDGTIVVVGSAPDPATGYTSQALAVYEFTPSGDLDTSFGQDGVATASLTPGVNSYGTYVDALADGSLVVGGISFSGGSQDTPFLVKFNPDGSVDSSWGSGGEVTVASDAGLAGLAMTASGEAVVAVNNYSNCPCGQVYEYQSDGSPDTSFGNQGTATLPTGLSDQTVDNVYAIATDPDGRILIGGSAPDPQVLCTIYSTGAPSDGCYQDMAVWALTSDGQPDSTFGNGGLTRTTLPNLSGYTIQNDANVEDVAVQPDGSILAVGTHQYSYVNNYRDIVIARLHPDGTADESWGSSGVVTISAQSHDPDDGAALYLAPDAFITQSGDLALGITDYLGQSGTSRIEELVGGEGPISNSQLATEYDPELMYDSEEPYFADSVAEAVEYIPSGNTLYAPLLKNSAGTVLGDPLFGQKAYAAKYDYTIQGLFKLSLANLRKTYPASAGTAQPTDYIDEPDNYMSDYAYLHGLAGNAGQTYAEVIRGDGTTWIEYWFYYYYNNGVLGFDDHEGDWEGIAIELGADYQITQVVFSEHSGASVCQVGQFQQSSQGGPVVYVANGSHASEPGPGSWTTDFPGIDDTVEPDPSVIPPVYPNVNLIASNSPSWVAWPGVWGGSGSSPQGPAGPEHAQRWSDPAAWAAGAGTCFSRQDAPPPPASSHAARAGARLRQETWSQALARVPARPAGVQIESATVSDDLLTLVYRSPASQTGRNGWPRLLVRFSAPGQAPQFVEVQRVGRTGVARIRGHFDPQARWLVQASLFFPRARSKVTQRVVRAQ